MIWQAVWTILGTIIAGTFVFVLGQVFQRIVLEPVQEQRKNVARIAQALTVHRYAYLFRRSYTDSPEAKQKIDVTSSEIKRLAADLRAGYALIPKNDWFARLGLVPDHETVRLAAIHLIQWQAFENDMATQQAVQRIAELLNIKFIATEEQELNHVRDEAAKNAIAKDAK